MHPLEKLRPLALLLLRCGLGVIFVYHGYPKLVHPHQWMQNFTHMGFPSYFAVVSGVVESLGGILLVLGLLARAWGLLLAGEMALALWKVYLPQGGIWNVGNYQLPLALAVGAFAIMTFGAGAISLDHIFFRKKG